MGLEHTRLEWQEIILEHEFAEELGEELIVPSLAMHSAIRIECPTRIVINIFASADEARQVLSCACNRGFRLISCISHTYQADIAQHDGSWQTLQIGRLSIVPVAEASAIPNSGPGSNQLYILPGSGWGTGTHPTTALPLELMQRDEIVASKPSLVLDLGCGSGILALGAEILYGAQIDAIDNDALALENARVNLTLNRSQNIRLIEGTISAAQNQYDLIVANIYAQVLLPLARSFKKLCSADGQLILSGLNETSVDENPQNSATESINGASLVLQAYQSEGWILREKLSRDGWTALHLQKSAVE